MAGDIVATTLLLPILVCLIATPLIRSEVARARLPAANWLRPRSRRVVRLPRNLLLRALVLGLITTAIVSPVMILALSSLGLDGLAFWTFVTLKAAFAAALGAVITPLVAARAVEDAASGAGAPLAAS